MGRSNQTTQNRRSRHAPPRCDLGSEQSRRQNERSKRQSRSSFTVDLFAEAEFWDLDLRFGSFFTVSNDFSVDGSTFCGDRSCRGRKTCKRNGASMQTLWSNGDFDVRGPVDDTFSLTRLNSIEPFIVLSVYSPFVFGIRNGK